MDSLSKAFYESNFKIAIIEKTETQFEDFFSEVMQLKYDDNFMPCQPWGSDGDKKNDGYLIDERHLFAVNGPRSIDQNRMISKIDSDLRGALDYWEEYFDKWAFVHNQHALTPKINKKLLELGTEFNQIKMSFWGPNELKSIIFSLADTKVDSILGPIPSRTSFNDLTFEDIQPVIKSISKKANPATEDLKPVPEDKLVINGLSDPIIALIRTGLMRAPLVRQYFNLQTSINLGDEIAGTLKNQYEYYRDVMDLEPDDIYSELVNYIADNRKKENLIYMVAIHTILAYFFEQCTVFEDVGVK